MSLTTEQLIADVADVLYIQPTELDYELSLRDQGMDSVRLMDLVERWRTAGVDRIDFITLAEDSRLGHWIEVIEKLQTGEEVAS
ncbi:acyl carrier protein [Kribbella sandramycini]|uniref:Acyl carrier protein n=1 Tax=Kribbella sandramycini TaxID=60450 RepID=A0A7Y4P175_9ACTN|nr:phosphopantetheine-binding protein [Kribbella sandramycini]MBB6571207.1 aryl carrier-like protein [Kribbella sandramycini]NOL43386.1 acyl carrier protein [Kribbella sandramycini]